MRSAILKSQKLAKSNVQTSPCDRREPANVSSLYLAVNPRLQQSAPKLKISERTILNKEARRSDEDMRQSDCISAVIARRLNRESIGLGLGGIFQSVVEARSSRVTMATLSAVRTSSSCTSNDARASRHADRGPLIDVPIVAKSCGATRSHWLTPAPHEQHNRLRAISKFKHDLSLRSADIRPSVYDAVLAPVRYVDQRSTS